MMADIEIRTATPFDAEELLGIYSYYIINTAVTYEIDVPSAEDFRRRIEKTLKKYPYIVAEREEGLWDMHMPECSRTGRLMSVLPKRRYTLM